MKLIASCLLFLLTTNISFAKEKPVKDKPFQDYIEIFSDISSACANARDFKYAVKSGTICELSLIIGLFQKPGANLIRLAKQRKFHPISFWVEERIEDGMGNWKRISGVKQYRFNDVWQDISFTVSHSAVYRVAVDYMGQTSFADVYGSQYKVSVK